MPETFDVDHAFEALAQDVMHRAGPPSAGGAIKQARHRRRTTLATAAAAALVVVAGVVVPTMVGGDDSSRVADNDGVRPLPAPASFAPEGWGPIGEMDPQAVYASTCTRSFFGPAPARRQAVAWGNSELARGDDRLTTLFVDFADDADSADQVISGATTQSTGCGASTTVPRYSGGELRHFASTEGGVATDLWVARIENRVALSLAVSKTPATTEGATVIADSLLASLRAPLTWEATTRASMSEGQRVLEDVGTAFGAWSPSWREPVRSDPLPCVNLPRQDPETQLIAEGMETSGGDVTITFQNWRTEDQGTWSRDELLSYLAECSGYRWQVEETGPTAWIATSDVGTVWIVQDAEAVAVLQARDGINPPDEVTADVVALLTAELTS